MYRYPARQISWDATGDPGSERGPYVVVSNAKAPADLNVPVVRDVRSDIPIQKLNRFQSDSKPDVMISLKTTTAEFAAQIGRTMKAL